MSAATDATPPPRVQERGTGHGRRSGFQEELLLPQHEEPLPPRHEERRLVDDLHEGADRGEDGC